MADTLLDADNAPIHFSEEFRRAKRNALFWASTTILFALGTAAIDGRLELKAIIEGVSFPSGLLTTICFLATSYMLFGYRRAEKRLLNFHTPFAIELAMGDAAEQSRVLADRLRKYNEMVAQRIETFRPAVESVRAYLDDFETGWLRKISSEFVQNPWRDATTTIPPPRTVAMMSDEQRANAYTAWAHQLQERLSQTESSARAFLNEKLAAVERGLGEATNQIRQIEIQQVEITDTDVAGISAEFVLAAERMQGFAANIGKVERRWFTGFDRGIVWGLGSLALILAVVRLVAPDALAAGVDFFFASEQYAPAGPASLPPPATTVSSTPR